MKLLNTAMPCGQRVGLNSNYLHMPATMTARDRRNVRALYRRAGTADRDAQRTPEVVRAARRNVLDAVVFLEVGWPPVPDARAGSASGPGDREASLSDEGQVTP